MKGWRGLEREAALQWSLEMSLSAANGPPRPPSARRLPRNTLFLSTHPTTADSQGTDKRRSEIWGGGTLKNDLLEQSVLSIMMLLQRGTGPKWAWLHCPMSCQTL
uniref:Uncharacterized protein n=1 Tax=Micrurus paraensis TaxID=1970185 RepID=A0A2D4KYL8_9SAUR